MARSTDRGPDRELSKRDRPARKKPRRPPKTGHRLALGEQIEDPNEYGVRTYGRPKRKRAEEEEGEGAEDEDALLSGPLSARILKEAAAQREEVDADDAGLGPAATDAGPAGALLQRDSDSDDEGELEPYDEDADRWDDEDDVSPEDERALAAFMAPGAQAFQQRTLADIIADRIRDHEGGGEDDGGAGGDDAAVPQGLDPRVVEVYRGVGQLLRRYTVGRLPKAFKIIPNLRNWEEVRGGSSREDGPLLCDEKILYLTDLEQWSPHAVHQATRLFVSNLNAKLAQRFMATVLLPHVRQDIRANRRLHFALFQALKKATYKPDAFYKGLLLPLCQAGNCTLREAVIFGSVIKRVSLPVLHSAAALLRVAEMEWSGTNSWFIRVLLDKKYALPYRVVDALVDHFARFAADERQLPTVWHQALLVFVQRYKHEIRAEDKAALKRVTRAQHHHQITPEVHRELDASRNRGEKPSDADVAAAAATMRKSGTGGENPRDLPPVVLMDED